MDTLTFIRDGVVTQANNTGQYMNSMIVGGGDAHYFDDTVTLSEIRENLDSNKETGD